MEQQQQVELDVTTNRKQLFANLLEIIRVSRIALKRGDKQSEQNVYQDSGSEGDCSSGEDDDISQQQQQTESDQDLQEELARLEISEEATTLETLIIIVEHYVTSGDRDGFMKNVRRPDSWLLTITPRPKISDLSAMAENLQKQELYFRAVMMHKAMCALYKYEYVHHPDDEDTPGSITPNDAVDGIETCMGKVFEIFNNISDRDDCKTFLPHFVAILYDMLTNLREIHHANRKYKADLEAWGLLYIAVVHGRLDELSEMRDVAETVVKMSERRFKKKAQHHLVYGTSLLSLSLSHRLTGGSVEAGECGKSSIAAFQESKGMSWDEKVKTVAEVQRYVDMLIN